MLNFFEKHLVTVFCNFFAVVDNILKFFLNLELLCCLTNRVFLPLNGCHGCLELFKVVRLLFEAFPAFGLVFGLVFVPHFDFRKQKPVFKDLEISNMKCEIVY